MTQKHQQHRTDTALTSLTLLTDDELAELNDQLPTPIDPPVRVVTLGRRRPRVTPHASRLRVQWPLATAALLVVGLAVLSSVTAGDRVAASDLKGDAAAAQVLQPQTTPDQHVCIGSADAAEHWLASDPAPRCLPSTTAMSRCFGSADAAEHWLSSHRSLSNCKAFATAARPV